MEKEIDEVRLTPDEYIEDHWIPNKIYKHCYEAKHTLRYQTCVDNIVGHDVLDYGCATGHSIDIMDNLSKGKHKWFGTDISEVALRTAKEFFPKYTYLKMISDYQVNTNGLYFDTVICTEVIEHVASPGDLVFEVYRLAKKRAVFTTPINIIKDPTHMVVFRRLGLEVIFDAAGFPYEIFRIAHDQNSKHYVVVVNLER